MASIDIEQFGEAPDGRALYRRKFCKNDGRSVWLYGYAPPNAAPVHEGLERPASASELRWHPLRREWNVYAAARQNRTYKPSSAENPLAPSQPGAPPTEIPFEDFELAVFENRYPSFHENAAIDENIDIGVQRAPARGRCEVVVYSPEDNGSLATLAQERRVLLVKAWIDRYRAIFAKGFDTVLPFENRGDEVGVTLHHPHGQIYAFGFTPPVQEKAVKAFEDGFDLGDKLTEWRAPYGVCENGAVLAFAPPFARFPFEIWIAPFAARRGLWDFNSEEIEGFATLLGDVTARYDRYFGRPCPYMLSLHAAPKSAGEKFHFTAQFYPLLRAADKIKYLASVEQATGLFTVDVMPEAAAKKLRDI